MNFELSQELKDFQNAVKDYVEKIVMPHIMEYEEKSVFPRHMMRDMGARGFLKGHIPKEVGGGGLGTLAYCLWSEEVSKAGAGMTHNGNFQTGKMLLERGTPKQKQKYLAKLLSGEYHAATAISEPTVGSSFADMQTKAEKHGDIFVLNGIKTLINDAAESEIVNIFARDEGGISVFILEKKTPGFNIKKKLDPIGMRSSPIYEFELKNCEVAEEQLIGVRGEGLKTFFQAFNFSRLGNSSAALGIAQAVIDKTINYLKGRRVGKSMASEFQGLRWLLVELSTQLEAVRLLRNRAALMEDMKQDISIESSRVKLATVQLANRAASECIQATGHYGCLRNSFFDIYLRDARTLGIAGGSLEVMRNNIARQLIGG